MSKGRPPKPTAVKRLAGTLRKHRENRDEPQPPAGEIHRPAHLDARARREWRRLRPILESAGVLTVADYAMFGALCQQIALAAQVTEQIGRDGLIVDGKPHPLLKVSKDANRQILNLSAEFGITPASRDRVSRSRRGNL